jgi:cytochrome o ubiquinol oxidase subunit 3
MRTKRPGGYQFYLTEEVHPQNGTLLGFWLYLMSDCLIFACLFAAYGVLGREYAGDRAAPSCSSCRWWR